jgi:transposase
MGKRAEVKTEMTAEMLYERYRRAKDPVERTHWHMLWQVKEGKSPQEVAEVFGYTAGWVRKMIRRWNAAGEAGITDHRRHLPGAKPLLTAEQQRELAQALQQPPADGGLWSGPKVAAWMQEKLGREIDPRRGWDYLQRLGYSTRVPRPQHAKADEETQRTFKKTARGSGGHSPGVSPSQRGTVEHR